jgi:hypothetical protein
MTSWTQIQREKFQLFQLLMYVPRTVIKHLTKTATHGYDAMRLQLDAVQSSAGVNDNEEREMEEREVLFACRLRSPRHTQLADWCCPNVLW